MPGKWICALILYLIHAVSVHGASIVLGAEDDAAPWSFADGSGYVNTLIREAFRAVDWEVSYTVMPYARCKHLVMAGEIAGCFSMSRTRELEAALLFPDTPVFVGENWLFVDKESPLQGCDRAT